MIPPRAGGGLVLCVPVDVAMLLVAFGFELEELEDAGVEVARILYEGAGHGFAIEAAGVAFDGENSSDI